MSDSGRRSVIRWPSKREGAPFVLDGRSDGHAQLPQVSVKRNDAKTAPFSRTGAPRMAAPGPDRSPQAPSDDGRGRRGHTRSVVRQCSPSAITS
jgi:hypothetical protein